MANLVSEKQKKQFWRQENAKSIYDYVYVFVGYVDKHGKKRKTEKKENRKAETIMQSST